MSSSPPSTTNTHRNPNQTQGPSITATTIVNVLVSILVAVCLAGYLGSTATGPGTDLFGLRRFFGGGIVSSSRASSTAASASAARQAQAHRSATMTARTPVYFLSHGGPNVMYQIDHPAYLKLSQIGREITRQVKPRAVIVFSAHWQGGTDTVWVNTGEMEELIYDFYGFPDHYYKEKYPHVGSSSVAQKLITTLASAGIKAESVNRGLDHGVWASFKCAFDPETNPLNVPIVQASLFNSEDPIQHYRLGQALMPLREEGILIIVSGMAVHNLRDMMLSFGDPTPLPYTVSFDEALKDAATSSPGEREGKMAALLRRGDARQAHPFFDHLLPIHIGAGAAGDDRGKRLWTLGEGSLSWAQYRFGGVNDNSEASL